PRSDRAITDGISSWSTLLPGNHVPRAGFGRKRFLQSLSRTGSKILLQHKRRISDLQRCTPKCLQAEVKRTCVLSRDILQLCSVALEAAWTREKVVPRLFPTYQEEQAVAAV